MLPRVELPQQQAFLLRGSGVTEAATLLLGGPATSPWRHRGPAAVSNFPQRRWPLPGLEYCILYTDFNLTDG